MGRCCVAGLSRCTRDAPSAPLSAFRKASQWGCLSTPGHNTCPLAPSSDLTYSFMPPPQQIPCLSNCLRVLAQAVRMTRAHAEKARQEREAAELAGLLSTLQDLDQIAQEVEEETASTGRVMKVCVCW